MCPDTSTLKIHGRQGTWTKNTTTKSRQLEKTIPLVLKVHQYSNIYSQLVSTLWIVTDAGVTDNTDYFGWVIATDTTILFEGKGTVPGNGEEMDSCRAESVSLLEAVKYVVHLQETNTTLSQPRHLHFCDNIIVTKRMQQ